ncbi:hypothetical protein JOM56_006614 [Amanita muscaria]
MRQRDSPASSPARKRQRLSSPPYEGSIDLFSQEDLASIDALESKYLQSISGSSQLLESNTGAKSTLSGTDIPNDDADDAKNPFLSALPGFASASLLRSRLDVSASTKLQDDLEKSDNLESEPNPDVWFQSASNARFPGFQAASGTRDLTAGSSAPPGFASAGVGFTTAGNKSTYAPSKTALAAARAKIEAIWNEEEKPQDGPTDPSSQTNGDVFAGGLALQKRPALQAVENAFHSPRTPLYSTVNSRNLGFAPISPLLERLKDKGKGKARDVEGAENVHCDSSGPSTNSCSVNPSNLTKSRQFVSPLLTHRTSQQAAVETSPNPASENKTSAAPTSATSRLPTSQRHFVTPRRVLPTTGVAQPYPTMGMRKGATNRPFVTPFKPGIRSEEHGPSLRKNALSKTPCQSKVTTLHLPGEKRPYQRFFQLIPPANRVTLKSFGLFPQQYEVDDMDASLIELTQITPSLAPFYSFNSSSDVDKSLGTLGAAAAFDELKRRGCSLASKSWVDNHWSLVLWKLSGMALLDPHQEKDQTRRKWCWSEVMRQLLYRYERELNQGKRPALRMVTTQDASAACPMVLCISDIFWSERGRTADGLASDRVPELEVTDGWYRLRAAVDTPMARAVGRGVIRIGRKIGVAGARLSSEKKEPSEVLEAYNNVKLLLSGNSSHLMPWHAKLGFQRIPFISTLHSLTTDGGCIAVLNALVTKVYPVAYFEFFEDGGQKRREGPRSEAEETKLYDKWKRGREQEACKLRSELDKRFNRFENYADRLISRAGTRFNPSDDESPPANIDELYDLLEDPTEASATVARLNPVEAGWLARHIHASIAKEKAKAGDDMESDLKKCYPPREVRSFRVVVVQDACTRRRPANRVAQITVWDALGLCSEEGSTNVFQVGQKYLITNLIPTQQSAWMNHEPGSQIFLSTRRDSRWTRTQ